MNTLKLSRFPFVMCTFLSLAFILTTSCEKENFSPETGIVANTLQTAEYDHKRFTETGINNDAVTNTLQTAEYDHKRMKEEASPFAFRLTHFDCFDDGRTYQVQVDAPEDYSIVWTVNGQHAGHAQVSPSCLCDGTATVYVTRLKDGITLSKTVQVPSCDLEIE